MKKYLPVVNFLLALVALVLSVIAIKSVPPVALPLQTSECKLQTTVPTETFSTADKYKTAPTTTTELSENQNFTKQNESKSSIPDTNERPQHLVEVVNELEKNFTEMKMKEVDQVNKQNERIKGVEDSLKQAEKKRNELQKHLGELQENQDNMLPAIRKIRTHSHGWFAVGDEYEYRITNGKKTWLQARDECRSLGGDLATRGMRDTAIRIAVKRGLTSDLWIGIRKDKWIDYSNENNYNWKPGEPNNHFRDEDCGTIFRGSEEYRANDDYCEEKYFGICEKQLRSPYQG